MSTAVRLALLLVHFLIGLLAIAFVAGAVASGWPSAAHIIWPIAYAAMALLAIHTLYRAIGPRKLPQGDSRG